MYKILSIDWDYFLNIQEPDIYCYFPEEENNIWSKCYRKYPKLLDIKINQNNLNYIRKLINKQEIKKVYIADEHTGIYSLIVSRSLTEDKKDINIINIDAHHDVYCSILGDDWELFCGNWLLKLYQKEYLKVDSTWIGHDISYEFGIAPYIDCQTTNLNIIKNNKFDMIFICKSAYYTPPHLDKYFIDFINSVNKEKVILEGKAMSNRLNRYKNLKCR